jgi:hypothetical protein
VPSHAKSVENPEDEINKELAVRQSMQFDPKERQVHNK